MLPFSRFLAATAALLMGTAFAADLGQVAAYAIPAVTVPRLERVVLNSVDTDEKFTLEIQPGHPQVLAASLPEGRYWIYDMVRSRKDIAHAPIEVRARQVTELGGLRWIDIGNHERALIAEPHADASAALKAWPSQWPDSPRSQWTQDRLPIKVNVTQDAPLSGLGLIADLISLYEKEVNRPSVKQQLDQAKSPAHLLELARLVATPTYDELSRDADGNLLVGAEMGQLRERKPSGEWTAIDTGTASALTAVYAGAGTRVVGTADGRLLARQADGRWQARRRLDPTEVVLDIDRLGKRWFVLVGRFGKPLGVLRSVDGVVLYSGSADDFSDLSPLRRISGRQILQPVNRIRGQVQGERYYLNADDNFGYFEGDSADWHALKPGHAVTHLRITPATGTLTAFKAQGGFSKLSVSEDSGASWKSLDTPPYTVADVQLQDATHGLAARFSMGAFSSNIEILSLEGAKWAKVGEFAPAACRRTLKSEDGQHWFCLSAGGSILRIEDGKLKVESAVE